MAGMAEVSKSPRRLYSVVRNLEWAFPATFVLGIIAVPFWSADMYAGMALSLTAVALAFGLLRPRRVEKSLGKWRIWLVSLLAPLAVLQVVLGLAALWHGSLVGGRTRTLAFQAEIADADRVVIRKGGGGCHGHPDRDDVLYVITNKTELAEFGKMFRFSGSSMPCGCCGYPGVDWWKGNKRLVLSAIHHGHALGVKGFPGIDLRLSSSSRLALSKWFEEHCGIDIENDGGWTDHRDDASPGEWQQEKTSPRPMSSPPHSARCVNQLSAPECSALRLPYSDSSLEMLVLLPTPSIGSKMTRKKPFRDPHGICRFATMFPPWKTRRKEKGTWLQDAIQVR